MFDWPLHRDFSLLFAISEVGSFTCIGCDSPIHGTDGLESPPKDLAMRIKRLAKGRYCRGGIWTHAEPPVWKFAVYTLALRPLGHDSSATTAPRSYTNILIPYILIREGDVGGPFPHLHRINEEIWGGLPWPTGRSRPPAARRPGWGILDSTYWYRFRTRSAPSSTAGTEKPRF